MACSVGSRTTSVLIVVDTTLDNGKVADRAGVSIARAHNRRNASRYSAAVTSSGTTLHTVARAARGSMMARDVPPMTSYIATNHASGNHRRIGSAGLPRSSAMAVA